MSAPSREQVEELVRLLGVVTDIAAAVTHHEPGLGYVAIGEARALLVELEDGVVAASPAEEKK